MKRVLFATCCWLGLLAPIAHSADKTEISVDMEVALGEDFFETCYYLLSRYQAEIPHCSAKVIEAVCAQRSTDLDGAIEKLFQSEVIKGWRNSADLPEVRNAVKSEFKAAARTCLLPNNGKLVSEGYKELDPEAASASFWRDLFKNTGRAIYTKALSSAGKGSLKGSTAKLIGGLFCDGVLTSLKDFFSEGKVDWNNDQCVEAQKSWRAAQNRSCLGTAASMCRSAAGIISLDQWPLLESENEIVKNIESIASVGLEYACGYIGASPICGTISAAMEQIAQFIKTGNNDWAECTGISQAALCVGQTIGAGGNIFTGRKGWVNNSGIEMAYFDKDRDMVVKNCCSCERRYYEKYFFGSGLYHSEPYLSPIQKGDFETSNCRYVGGKYEGSKFYTGDKRSGNWVYYSYEGCRKVLIEGNSCALQKCTDGNCVDREINYLN